MFLVCVAQKKYWMKGSRGGNKRSYYKHLIAFFHSRLVRSPENLSKKVSQRAIKV